MTLSEDYLKLLKVSYFKIANKCNVAYNKKAFFKEAIWAIL